MAAHGSRWRALGWALLGLPTLAAAHALAPSRLQADESPDGRVALEWRTPARVMPGSVAPQPLLPGDCTPEGAPQTERVASTYRMRWTIHCPAPGLVGREMAAEGLAGTLNQVLLSVHLADGRRIDAVLTEDRPRLALTPPASRIEIAREYLQLGVEHILTGWDHLAFVAVLVLLSLPRGAARVGRDDVLALLRTVTAFTAGHSLTLLASATGWLKLPQPPVEAGIALSIAWVAHEVLRSGTATVSRRTPWLTAAGFGLLHGLGFAGALREVGLPEDALLLALLLFNLGIEAGQLLFIGGLLLPLVALSRRLGAFERGGRGLAWAVGALAAYWFWQRLLLL
jgi:HupE / UreJ protein